MSVSESALSDSADLERHAAALLRREVRAVARANPGGNNRLYCVQAGDGQRYALKSYLGEANDNRDRIGAECAGLAFAWGHGLRRIPCFVASDPQAGLALFEWIDGQPVAAPSEADVDAALAFLTDLRRLRDLAGAEALPAASEACLSADELRRQITRRRARLFASGDARIIQFLSRPFPRAWSRFERRAKRRYEALGLDFEAELALEYRTLSPSDFGFHNALRRPNGELVFLDFEYFGWDDPAKLVADFLLHPGMRLSDQLKCRFRCGAARLFQDDPHFEARLDLLYPLYGLRWCLILLNAFLPERWERQAYAQGGGEREEVQNRQLAKAKAMLAHVTETEGVLCHVS